MCLAQGHNAVRPVRLKPMALRSRVKGSTTEPLRSLSNQDYMKGDHKPLCKMILMNYIATVIYNVDIIKPSFDVILNEHPTVQHNAVTLVRLKHGAIPSRV